MANNRVFTPPIFNSKLSDSISSNAGGKLYFYEPGEASTTPKSVYAKPYNGDSSDVLLSNPVIANSAGAFPVIHLNGDYRVICKTSAGAKLWDISNYQRPEIDAQFDDWRSYFKYAEGDYARGSNGLYYVSRIANNLNNDPTISTTAWKRAFVAPYDEWVNGYPYENGDAVTRNGKAYISQLAGENLGNDPASDAVSWYEVYYVEVYNANRQYYAANNTIVKYLDDFFVCTADTLGNTPSTGSSYWRSFFFPAISAGYTSTSFEYQTESGAAISQFDVGSNIAHDTWESIGPTGSGADNIWSALDTIPSDAKSLTLRISPSIQRTGTTDDILSYEVRARKNGSATDSIYVTVGRGQSYGGAASNNAYLSSMDTFTVPTLDGVFDLKYTFGGDTASGCLMYLIGFKS